MNIVVSVLVALGVVVLIGGSSLVDRLGRKGLKRKVLIAPELESTHNQVKRDDPERNALATYLPKAAELQNQPTALFRGSIDRVLADLPEPVNTFDIDEVADLLTLSALLPYSDLFGGLSQEPQYPIPDPDKPPDPKSPPEWKPWSTDIPDPSIELPLYTGWRSILNGFVTSAHKAEIEKVQSAKKRRADIQITSTARDQAVRALAEKALNAWDLVKRKQEQKYAGLLLAHKAHAEAYINALTAETTKAQALWNKIKQPGAEGLLTRIDLAMRTMKWPHAISRESQSRFDAESGVLIHEHRFPDLSAIEWLKFVELKAGLTPKPANQKERKEAASKVWPSMCLRLACEIARVDDEGIVKAVAINGWADYTDKATGQRKRAYCASLFATNEQLVKLNLAGIDPVVGFNTLKGISAHTLEVTPIAPILRLDMNDPRFIDAKEVLSRMAEGENLAIMNWEDFEHLCRELFERAFAGSGAEVKVTQASRDQGVDAIIFDPDPLRGGKIIVQAKRYTNTVDVSAVRDLYGAVINEGATKGILVTTSHYGAESYAFAKDKPITLLNGQELLGLLEQHGYKFRIDLAEARRMLQ